jgi:effector-binding domain-containing protein
MLKIDQEFGIYDYSVKKAIKSLIKAGFIGIDDLDEEECEKLYYYLHEKDYEKLYHYLCDKGVLKYHKVTLHTAPIHFGAYPATDEDDNEVDYYDVEGMTDPMTVGEILNKYRQPSGKFVAICHKGEYRCLELVGFVY